MPLQVQGSIDGIAVYEPLVTVPADGEVLTAAGLADTAVALGRRIEETRLTQANPWLRCTVFDDFLHKARNDVGDQITCDTPWTMNGTLDSNITLGSGTVGANEGGVFRVSNTSGSGATFRIYKDFDALRYENFKRIVVRVQTSVVQANHDLEIGFLRSTSELPWNTDAPRDAISFGFLGTSNWRLRTNDGTTDGVTTSSVPVSINTWYTLDLRYDGVTAELYVDGALAASRTTTLPAGTLTATPQIKFATGTSGTRRVDFDFFYFRGDLPGRSF